MRCASSLTWREDTTSDSAGMEDSGDMIRLCWSLTCTTTNTCNHLRLVVDWNFLKGTLYLGIELLTSLMKKLIWIIRVSLETMLFLPQLPCSIQKRDLSLLSRDLARSRDDSLVSSFAEPAAASLSPSFDEL